MHLNWLVKNIKGSDHYVLGNDSEHSSFGNVLIVESSLERLDSTTEAPSLWTWIGSVVS